MSNDIKAAYAAGFFDGEGTISIQRYIEKRNGRPAYNFAVEVTQIKKAPLEKLKEWYGGQIKAGHTPSKKYLCWRWVILSESAEKFLSIIKPYSLVKIEEIILALEFRKTMGPQPAKNKLGQVAPLSNDIVEQRDSIIKKIRDTRARRTTLSDWEAGSA